MFLNKIDVKIFSYISSIISFSSNKSRFQNFLFELIWIIQIRNLTDYSWYLRSNPVKGARHPYFINVNFLIKKQSFIVKRKILQHGIELTAHWILLRFIHNIYSYTTPSVFLLCSWPFNKDLNQRDMSSNVIAIWALDSRHIYQIMKYCSENK